MMINIEELKADRAAGTQGDWAIDPNGSGEMSICAGVPITRVSMPGDCPGGVTKYPLHVIDGCGCCGSPFGNEEKAGIDARRIARVPELEAALIEAVDKIARLRAVLMDIAEHPDPNADDAAWSRVEDARKALENKP